MFDTENRNDPRRERSLLALDAAHRGESTASRPASLLAVADAAASEDAATRHRLARLRRETGQDPVPPAFDGSREQNERQAAGETAPGKTSWMKDFLPGWLVRRHGDEAKRKEAEPAAASPHGEDAQFDGRRAEYGNGQPAAGRELPDQQWKPLIDPAKVVRGIAKSRWLIVGTTFIGAVLGVAIAISTPKKYEASTELLVDPRDLNLVDRELTQTGLSNEGTLAVVENQVRVLTSGTVLTKVVDRLNLASDPEFNGEGSDGGIGAFISNLRSILSRRDGDDGGDRRHTLAVRSLSRSLTVARGGKTFVIVISAVTKDGEKSALIANTMTDVFLQTYGQIQSNTAGRAAEELTSRLDDLRAGVEAAERTVEAFKAENDIIDAQGRLITDDEIVKLNEQLSVARARTLELNAKASSTRSVNVDAVLGGVLPEDLSSPTIQELRAQYSALKSDADRLAVRLGPRHPERMAIEAQLSGARDLINIELRRVVSSTQTELKRAVQLEQELASRLAQLKVRQGDLSGELVTLRELEREATAKRAVYEAFLLRARQTGEQKDINTANMSVISTASPPLEANPPSRSTMALTGLMLGFFAGVGFGGMRGAYESLRDTANARATMQKRRGPEPLEMRADQRHEPADVMVQTDRPNRRPTPPTGYPQATVEAAPYWWQSQAAAPLYQPYPWQEQAASGVYPVQRPQQPLNAQQVFASHPAATAAPGPHQGIRNPPEPEIASQASLDEIRSSLREFREAVDELTQARQRRRYF